MNKNECVINTGLTTFKQKITQSAFFSFHACASIQELTATQMKYANIEKETQEPDLSCLDLIAAFPKHSILLKSLDLSPVFKLNNLIQTFPTSLI